MRITIREMHNGFASMLGARHNLIVAPPPVTHPGMRRLLLAPIASKRISYERPSNMWTIMHIIVNMEVRMGKALEVRARKSTNVTLPPDVLERAKELGINLSRASERGVREEIQETEARRWADDNAELVAAYTAMVERDGLPLAKYRTF
jgi:antitoxin CcdA